LILRRKTTILLVSAVGHKEGFGFRDDFDLYSRLTAERLLGYLSTNGPNKPFIFKSFGLVGSVCLVAGQVISLCLFVRFDLLVWPRPYFIAPNPSDFPFGGNVS
jgi:hypothetical protein